MARATRAEAAKAAESAQEVKHEPEHMEIETEHDVDSMPISSSDEESKPQKKRSSPDLASSASYVSTPTSYSNMAAASTLISKLPARAEFTPAKLTPPKSIESPAASVKLDIFDDLLWQPKKRRKVKGYGHNSNLYTRVEMKAEDEPTFATPDEIATSCAPLPTSNFQLPPSTASPGQRTTRTGERGAAFKQPVPDPKFENQKYNCLSFSIPSAMPNEPDSSAPSTADTIFDLSLSLPDVTRPRRQSLSSLSSLDSEVEYELSQEQKQNLTHDDTGDGMERFHKSELIRCRLCKTRVELSFLKFFTDTSIEKLKIREQQNFCFAHRQRRAQQIWKTRGYPTADWGKFATIRIPQQIPHLEKILRRKTPSVYLDRLEAASRDSKSRHNPLQLYLKDGIVDFVKHGYYGPRGARVMSHAIASHMSETLNQELQKDKIARAAGVGGYVNAVLVPELMVALVKEDMGVKYSHQARQILDESTELGTLLNGDDDEVLVREEDD